MALEPFVANLYNSTLAAVSGKFINNIQGGNGLLVADLIGYDTGALTGISLSVDRLMTANGSGIASSTPTSDLSTAINTEGAFTPTMGQFGVVLFTFANVPASVQTFSLRAFMATTFNGQTNARVNANGTDLFGAGTDDDTFVEFTGLTPNGSNQIIVELEDLAVSNGYQLFINGFEVYDIVEASGETITADSGSYTLTGADVGFPASETLTADAGSYALTGADVGLVTSAVLNELDKHASITLSNNNLSAEMTVAAHRGVRSDISIASGSGFYYYEGLRNTGAFNMGFGIATSATDLANFGGLTDQSIGLNTLGFVFYDNGEVIPSPDADILAVTDFGIAVDYRGANPIVYLIANDEVVYTRTMEAVTDPVFIYVYGHDAGAGVQQTINTAANLGVVPFHYDYETILSTFGVADTNLIIEKWGAPAPAAEGDTLTADAGSYALTGADVQLVDVPAFVDDTFDGTGLLGAHWQTFNPTVVADVQRRAGYLDGLIDSNIDPTNKTLWFGADRGRLEYQPVRIPSGASRRFEALGVGIGPAASPLADMPHINNSAMFAVLMVHNPNLAVNTWEFTGIGNRNDGVTATVETKSNREGVSSVGIHGADTLGAGVTHADFAIEVHNTGFVTFEYKAVGSGTWLLIHGTGNTLDPIDYGSAGDVVLIGFAGYAFFSQAELPFRYTVDSFTEVFPSFVMPADAGTYTLTGEEVGLLASYVTQADAGTYALTGEDVGLLASFVTPADAGSYALTGEDLGFSTSYSTQADAGSYALTGATVGLVVGGEEVLQADAGTYALTGEDVGLLASYVTQADAGSYALTGQDVQLVTQYGIVAEAGIHTLTGATVALVDSQGTTQVLTALTAKYGESNLVVTYGV